jgi:hypothetical protein
MARGKKSEVGETRVSPNGYHYTRTEGGWVLTHKLIAERGLGRPLAEGERIRFRDGDRTNLNASNIEVYAAKQGSNAKRIAVLEAKKEAIEAELAELRASS